MFCGRVGHCLGFRPQFGHHSAGGCSKVAQLEEALRATSVKLSSTDLAEIDQAVPPGSVAGDRYLAEQMAMLDSER